MLKQKHYHKNKNDWFRPKFYPHFDLPLYDRRDALNFVLNYQKNTDYGFYPLIQFNIEQKRYRTRKILSNGHYVKVIDKEKSTPKIRTINYPSHKDGYIFSFFAFKLSKLYEATLAKFQLNDAISAYRSGIGSNIDIAGQVFKFIKNNKNCICLAYDIEKFFDSLDHKLLKKQLLSILNVSKLPSSYYKIYKALTNYASINQNDLPKDKNGKLYKPVCDSKTLRQLKDKLYIHKKEYGIPQGTQISALLSNVYMLDFDIEINQTVKECNGLYKRYADDILIVIPRYENSNLSIQEIDKIVQNSLKDKAGGLNIQPQKTEKIIIQDGLVVGGTHDTLQYLGLTYNGQKLLIRNNSVSRYMRKMLGGIRRKIHLAKIAKKHQGTVFRTYLYHQYSHLGTQNFYSYVKNIENKLYPFFSSELGCRHQVRKHMNIMKKELSGIRTTKHHKK